MKGARPARPLPPLVELGRIGRPHGLRGEVRVALHNPGSDALLSARTLHLAGPSGRPEARAVDGARRSGRAVLLRLRGVGDRDAAAALCGSAVFLERAQLGALEPGEFYLADLVGARVRVREVEVGTVVEIRCHPSVDALVVRSPDGTVREQPLCDPWIAAVDVDAGDVELTSAEGLI